MRISPISSGAQSVAIGTGHADGVVEERLSGRREPTRLRGITVRAMFVRMQDGADDALGHPVDLGEDRSERRHRLLQQRDRHRRGGVLDAAQRILAPAPERGVIEQAAYHDRRQVRAGDVLLLDAAQHGGRVEGAVQDDRRGQHHIGKLVDLCADVKQRHHDQHPVGWAHALLPRDTDGRRQDRAVAEQNALRLAGGPAGIDEIDAVIRLRPQRRRRVRSRGENIFIALGPVGGGPDDDEALDAAALLAQAFHLGGELRLENQHRRRAVVEDLTEFLWRQPPVQRHRDEARPFRGADRLEIFETVLRKHGKPCLALQAASGKRIGEPAHARRELRKGDAPVLEDDSGLSRKIAGVALDDVTEHHRCVVHCILVQAIRVSREQRASGIGEMTVLIRL